MDLSSLVGKNKGLFQYQQLVATRASNDISGTVDLFHDQPSHAVANEDDGPVAILADRLQSLEQVSRKLLDAGDGLAKSHGRIIPICHDPGVLDVCGDEVLEPVCPGFGVLPCPLPVTPEPVDSDQASLPVSWVCGLRWVMPDSLYRIGT